LSLSTELSLMTQPDGTIQRFPNTTASMGPGWLPWYIGATQVRRRRAGRYSNGQGLPIGCHFFGRFGEEATLLRLASQLVAAQPWDARRPPAA
jgi:hypothetical protein